MNYAQQHRDKIPSAVGDIMADFMAMVKEPAPEPITDACEVEQTESQLSDDNDVPSIFKLPAEPEPIVTEVVPHRRRPSEMFDLNFAEFPFSHLTQRLPAGVDPHTITYIDTIKGRDGEPVPRTWTVTSHAKHGLGGPTSVDVFFELIQIWKEDNFKSDKIFIGTYHNLLRRLNKGKSDKEYRPSSKAYKQLIRDLESLYGLEIIAENAYYDTVAERYVTRKVKPFVGWRMWQKNLDSTKLDPNDYGYIEVNQNFFHIFKETAYHLPYDINIHKLTPHEQKLALYLSKIFNPYKKTRKNTFRRDIYTLCEQLPIYGTPRKQRHYLIKAVEGLIEKEYSLLEHYEIKGKTITFYNRMQESLFHQLYEDDPNKRPDGLVNYLLEEIQNVCGTNEQYLNYYRHIAKTVDQDVIFQFLSEARQEGKNPAKLFSHKIKEYLAEKNTAA